MATLDGLNLSLRALFCLLKNVMYRSGRLCFCGIVLTFTVWLLVSHGYVYILTGQVLRLSIHNSEQSHQYVLNPVVVIPSEGRSNISDSALPVEGINTLSRTADGDANDTVDAHVQPTWNIHQRDPIQKRNTSTGRLSYRDVQWQHLTAYQRQLLQCSKFDYNIKSSLLERQFQLPKPEYLDNLKNPCWWDQQANTTMIDQLIFSHKYNRPHAVGMARRAILYSRDTKRARGRKKQKDIKVDVGLRLRCLPYFYLAGMPKAASTDIYNALRHHPHISGCPVKEPMWWSKYRVGLQFKEEYFSPEDYIKLFDKNAEDIKHNAAGGNKTILGEASGSYMYLNDRWPLYPANIGQSEPIELLHHQLYMLTPQARIIVSLRNPIDRLYSHYYQDASAKDGRVTRSPSSYDFHAQVTSAVSLMNKCIAEHGERRCVHDACLHTMYHGKIKVQLRIGMYFIYIRDWLDVFPREQLKVVLFEEYAKSRIPVVNEIFNFLAVDPMDKATTHAIEHIKVKNKRSKSFSKKGAMLAETREVLYKFYQPYNQRLAEFLNDERFLWKN